jgi:hypothetical protein
MGAVELWQCVQGMVEEVVGDGFDPVLVIDVLVKEMDMLVADEVVDVGSLLVFDKLPEEEVDKDELLDVEELVLVDELELVIEEAELDDEVILDVVLPVDVVVDDEVDDVEEDVLLVEDDVLLVEEEVLLVEEEVVEEDVDVDVIDIDVVLVEEVDIELLETAEANKQDGMFTWVVLAQTRIATSEFAGGGRLLQTNVSKIQLPSVNE